MSTSGHHSQFLSRSNKSLNNQLPHLNNFIPQSHYHTFRRRLRFCRLNLQPQPQPNSSHLRSSSLCCRRSRLHQLVGNVTDSRQFRPFRKRTRKTNRSRHTALDSPTLRRHPLLPPLPTQLTISTPRPAHQIKLSEKEEQKVKTFLQLLDVWPSQQMQTFDNAEVRYRLTCEEKEQLKFLGLQNFFNTAWPKLDPRRRGPGRWKKN
jgi:hypothetical protein